MADPAMNRQRYAATRYQWTRPVRGQSGRVHCPLVRASRITSARNSGGYSGLLFGRWTPPLGPHPQIYRRPGHRVNITEGDNNAVGAGKGPIGSLEKETPSGHVLHCRMLAVKAPGVYVTRSAWLMRALRRGAQTLAGQACLPAEHVPKAHQDSLIAISTTAGIVAAEYHAEVQSRCHLPA